MSTNKTRIQSAHKRLEILNRKCMNCMDQKCHRCPVASEAAELEYSLETGHVSKRRAG